MKWIFAIIGFIFKGPVGGIIGFIIGAAIDAMSSSSDRKRQNQQQQYTNNSQKIFIDHLIVLTAAVMKADGVATKSELEYVKRFFVNSFGVQAAQNAMLRLRNALQQAPSYYAAATQLRGYTNYSLRCQLLQYLFGIAVVDGSISPKEESIVSQIAGIMGIASVDYESMRASFFTRSGYSSADTKQTASSAYKVLGVDENISDEELKTTYRTLAKTYHPDKFEQEGVDAQQKASKKFREINEAYEAIRTERGL